MKNYFAQKTWSPYAVGTGIGVLSWITFYFMHKALGITTTFVRTVGLVESIFSKAHVYNNSYFSSVMVGQPIIEWQYTLVLFIFFGAWVSTKLSKSTFDYYPSVWLERFGPSKRMRIFTTLTGGFMALFGARLAGGCTTGHGISGALKLATASWIFLPILFLSGIAVSQLIYKK